MIPRFRISTVFLLLVVGAIGLGWFVERRNLVRRIEEENLPIRQYGEKFAYWSPSHYLGVDNTSRYESALGERVAFSGETVTSSQGIGQPKLRQPDAVTLQSTISLLDDDDEETQLAAARLLALYLQASSGSDNLGVGSVTVRAQFQVHGLRRVRELLKSPDPNMRSAAALILGNTRYDSFTIQCLSDAFDNETDHGVKLHLAWAYWTIGSNYPRTDCYLKQKAARVADTVALLCDGPKSRWPSDFVMYN